VVQIWEMGMDLGKVMERTFHLEEDERRKAVLGMN
jgi:hypothetical protein